MSFPMFAVGVQAVFLGFVSLNLRLRTTRRSPGFADIALFHVLVEGGAGSHGDRPRSKWRRDVIIFPWGDARHGEPPDGRPAD
jgi:hypothetical protein